MMDLNEYWLLEQAVDDRLDALRRAACRLEIGADGDAALAGGPATRAGGDLGAMVEVWGKARRSRVARDGDVRDAVLDAVDLA